MLRSFSMVLFKRDAVLYKISASSNPAREVNGVQSVLVFGCGGGGGGDPGGRNITSLEHGFA
jgi:hypothetical protein